jgi:hypothetical protein
MEADEAFGERVSDAGVEGGPEAALALLRAEGFEASAEEMRDAFLDRFGDQLSQEQLNALAGGIDQDTLGIAGLVTTGIVGAAAIAVVAAAV